MKILEKIKNKQSDIFGGKPVTIAFLGDSVTQGCYECYYTSETTLETVFDYKNAYSTRVKEILNILYPSVQINVINSGISGDNAVNGLSRIDRDVLCFNPDLVVVGFALNDSCAGEDGKDRYYNAMSGIVDRVLKSGAECILLTPNMMNVKTSCHLKGDLFLNLAKTFANVQNSGMLTDYVNIIKRIATEKDVPICDIYKSWIAMSEAGVDVTELLANKFNHPIRELHYYTAMKIVEQIFHN